MFNCASPFRDFPLKTAIPAQRGDSYAVVLFLGALIGSLFHNGELTEAMSAALLLLMGWLAIALYRSYGANLIVPIDTLTVLLGLFCVWLGLNIFLSRVPYVSAINFWWLTASVLVFSLLVLSAGRERIVALSFRGANVVALVLVCVASYQRLVEGGDPRAVFYNHNALAALLALLSFPLLAAYLREYRSGSSRTRLAVLCAAFGLLQFGIAITGGRGVMLGFIVSLGVLYLVGRKRVPLAAMAIAVGVLLAAHLVAGLATLGEVSERLASMVGPAARSDTRWLIWEGTWHLLQQSPWYGIGIGTYWLAFPPFRLAADPSAGFYAHNDYLQLWIEAGWPGVALLLAVFVAVTVQFARALRSPPATPDQLVLLAGLYCGMLVVALHTAVDFDFYSLPIQLLLGLVLGAFHAQYRMIVPARSVWHFEPGRYLGGPAFRAITGLLLLFPAAYFLSLGFGAYSIRQAQSLASAAEWVAADAWMRRAARLSPASDLPLVVHADLLRQAVAALPMPATTERQALLEESRTLLDEAEKLNPLRPLTFLTRGLLYRHDPGQDADIRFSLARKEFEKALRLDPRQHEARVALARVYLERGDTAAARATLEGGAAYWYRAEAGMAPYYALLAQTRRATGDVAGAVEAERKIADLSALLAETRKRDGR